MFTNRDFLNYFNELEVLETTMRDIYKQAESSAKDPIVKKFFGRLYAQECEHKQIVQKVKDVIINKFFVS